MIEIQMILSIPSITRNFTLQFYRFYECQGSKFIDKTFSSYFDLTFLDSLIF